MKHPSAPTRHPASEPWLPRRDSTVLLLSASAELQGAVGRVCAAAAVELIVGDGLHNAAGRWDEIVAILLDSSTPMDHAEGTSLAGWRGPTVVVGFDADATRLWGQAADTGADRVAILPDSAAWLADYLGRLRNPGLGAGVVGVVGGCGGAGASTLAILLAAEAARRGTRTLLVDGDPLGGGLCTALSAQEVPGLRWPELLRASGSINPDQLAASLPQMLGLALLSWPEFEVDASTSSSTPTVARAAVAHASPSSEVMRAARGAYGLIVVDVGRSLASAASLAKHCHGILLVVPARPRAAAATRQLTATLPPVPIAAVVRGPLGEGLDAAMVATSVELPLLGKVPEVRRVAETLHAQRLPELLRRRSVRRLVGGALGWLSGQDYEGGAR